MSDAVSPGGVGATRGPRRRRPTRLDTGGTKRERAAAPRGRRRRCATVRVWIPHNLDARAVLWSGATARDVDYLHYFLHLIVRGRVLKKNAKTGKVRLKAKYMRKVIPNRKLPKIRAAAVNGGVIKWDRRYVKGKESMGYQLTEAYRVEPRQVECLGAVAAKIRKVRETEFFHVAESPEHQHLLKWLRLLEIDEAGARRTVLTTERLLEHADIHLTLIDMVASGHVDLCYCKYCRV